MYSSISFMRNWSVGWLSVLCIINSQCAYRARVTAPMCVCVCVRVCVCRTFSQTYQDSKGKPHKLTFG